MEKPKNVDAYIRAFGSPQKERLNALRSLVKSLAPDAEESISYGMPAYKTFKKPLVYFAAYDQHIGLYATPSGQSAFEEELKGYKQGKGSVQFPLNAELPLDLIERIIRYRVKENEDKAKKK